MNEVIQVFIIAILLFLSAFGGWYMAKRKIKKMEKDYDEEYSYY